MKKRIIKKLSVANILVLVLVLLLPVFYGTQKAEASNLTYAMIRTDRMAASTATTGAVCVKPTSTAMENKVILTFPASFTVGATGTWTVDTAYTAGWPSGATAWLVTSPTAVPASKTVTFTSPDLTVGTLYCFNWNLTTAINTGATTGTLSGASIETQDAGSVTIDKSLVQMYVLTTSDQVSVTGNVAPTFSMNITGGNTAPLGTIGNSVVNASNTPAVGVVTNARNGWTAWVMDANNGTLNSAGASSNIPAPVAAGAASIDLSTKATTGAYGLGITSTGGSPVLDPAYDGHIANYAGTLSIQFRPLASSATYSSADQITLIVRAVAKTTQAPASDYADTITVVAAGNF